MTTDNLIETKICLTCQQKFDESMVFCVNCGGVLQNQNEIKDKIINCEFEFKCPMKWENMRQIENEDARFCESCKKVIFFAHTRSELNEFAKEGKCVAVIISKANEKIISVSEQKCQSCRSVASDDGIYCESCIKKHGQMIVVGMIAERSYPIELEAYRVQPIFIEKETPIVQKTNVKKAKSWWQFWK